MLTKNRRPLTKTKLLLKYLILKFLSLKKSLNDSVFSFLFLYLLSILLRLFCICVIVYVTLVMIHETDSWIPLINLIFCLGILLDLVYFLARKNEHIG